MRWIEEMSVLFGQDSGIHEKSRKEAGSLVSAASALQGPVQDGEGSMRSMYFSGLLTSDLVYLDTSDELVSGTDSQTCTSVCEREPKLEVEQEVGCIGGILNRLVRKLRTRSLGGLGVEDGESKSSSFVKLARSKTDAIDKTHTLTGRLHVTNRGIVVVPDGRRSRRHHRTASMRARCDMIESFWTEPIKNDHLRAVHRRCISWDDAVEQSASSSNNRPSGLNKINHVMTDGCLSEISW